MTRAKAARTSALLLILFTASLPAHGAPESLGAYGSWSAWKDADAGRCYMVSEPETAEGNYTRRGKIYAYVDLVQGTAGPGVVSFKAGYRFREESSVDVDIPPDGRFELFVRDDVAWAYDTDDPDLVAAMRRGFTMIVRGTSWRGTLTTDTYSLRGFTAAHEAIVESCTG